MIRAVDLVRRGSLQLRPDPSRVITRPFLPGQELLTQGISRADSVVRRVAALSEDEVTTALDATVASFAGRHPDLLGIFREHFALVSHRIPRGANISMDRADLIGAYFTMEYAIEGAAVCNPSIVADPAQDGVGPGELRFIMSLRGIGEGHLSTIGFRRGLLGPDDRVSVEEQTGRISTGVSSPSPMSLGALRRALGDQGDAEAAENVLSLLPDEFTPADLEDALALSERDTRSRPWSDGLLDRIRRLVASNYLLVFPDDLDLSARVLHPVSPAEARGMEDARFTAFVGEDGTTTHYATYTAYDGSSIAPHLIQTDDFRTFSVRQQTGEAATNKGMALFPRRIDGRFFAISRWDRENLSVASSTDALDWENPVIVQRPRRPWDLVQLGSCASPLETPEGWLVITHGVGAVRTYALGAILLDLDDPTWVLGTLDEPLMTVQPLQREGYVPNVVYSCGALIHGSTVVLPYGCNDASIRFAFVDLPGLLEQLKATRSTTDRLAAP
ncbi:MAG: glycosidase-like protein [Lapillicoccus sp.]